MNLVDTSGWIEYFAGGKNATFFTPPIEDTGSLILPTVCVFEVYKKLSRDKNEKSALEAIAQMKQGQVVPLSVEMAMQASLTSLKHGLAMADSIIYASAQGYNAIIWTQDHDFKDLPGVNYRPGG